MQKLSLPLLLLSLIFFHSSQSLALPPEVSTPQEVRLYQGSPEEITAFITQRQAEIDKIIETLDRNIDKSADKGASQELQSSTTAVKDLYSGLALQGKSLLKELSRTVSTTLNRPTVEGPPYSVEGFDKIISFQQQTNLLLADCNKKFTLMQNRLASLKDATVSQLSDYAKFLKTNPQNQLPLYEKYGKLLNLQNEYALLQIKKPKLEKQLAELNENKKSAAAWVKEAFAQLKITPEDVDSARKQLEASQTSFKDITEATSSEYQDLNSRIQIYEIQLDDALAQLEANKTNNSPERDGLYVEKERIELILDALKLRLRMINQKRLNFELKALKNNFRLQWLSNYESGAEQKSLTVFVTTWSLEAEQLARRLETTTTAISDVTLARSNLIQKQVTINNKEAAAVTAPLREALGALGRQADKVNENIDKLILALSENDQDLRNARREIEQILDLTRFSISLTERMRTWSAIHLAGLKDKALSVLYYPLFSFGTSTVTLLIIFKIIVLLFLGIFFLRLLRHKIAVLLKEKAGMSGGVINSITTLGYYACLLIGTLIILSTAGLDLSQLSIILGALGVGIGFGLQTITNNFISGIILLTEQTVKVGDLVSIGDDKVGEVIKLAIRATIVRTIEGEEVIIPNSDFISSRVNTWTYSDDWRRLNIPFGVSYDSDPDEIVRLAEAAAREVPITREDFMHPLRIFFEGFGDNSLDFSIRVWCRMTNLKAPSGLKSDYYFALFRKFKEAGVVIPFPQRDLHLQTASPQLTAQLKALIAPDRDNTKIDGNPTLPSTTDTGSRPARKRKNEKMAN
ncbi:MAG: mechanosensitive ion channel [Deltaproteobacteria bacterium]|nr:mechanosensitive ion channel [Deltaproteobacteria bacterium]